MATACTHSALITYRPTVQRSTESLAPEPPSRHTAPNVPALTKGDPAPGQLCNMPVALTYWRADIDGVRQNLVVPQAPTEPT